jgi:hypothetical protein
MTGMAANGERGSALVITLMLLLILTAIGIYAVSISTTEMGIALHSRVGTSTLNSAESGANFGIDQIPTVYTAAFAATLADQSRYSRNAQPAARIRIQFPVRGLRSDESGAGPGAVRRHARRSGRCRLRAGSRGDDVLNEGVTEGGR